MRGGVRIAEACRAVDRHAHAARRVLPIAIAEIPEPPGIAGAVEQLRVFQRDLTGLARCDWEDTRPNQSLALQLDQRGIAFLPHDRFVDRARLRGIHRLTAQLLITLPERVAREDRLTGK